MTTGRTEGCRPGPSEEGAALPIDRAHLVRMTLGDKGLEREVLALFARQADALLADLAAADAKTAASIAHRLKGSAQGIGAWRVAEEAEKVERQADQGTEALSAAAATLKAAVEEAKAAAEDLLRAR